MSFTKKDLLFSVITGVTAGAIIWQVAHYTHRQELFGVSYAWLMALVPVVWILGVNLGYFLGRFFGFFNQFGRFAAIGFTNFAVDSGVLTVLLSVFGVTAGLLYTVSKAVSFVIASVHSFAWNKFWVFQAGGSGNTGVQFGKFFGVSLISLAVNVGVASVIVNFVKPVAGLNSETWAVAGSIVGSAVALIFSFIGFRMAVFAKKDATPDTLQKIQTPGL